MTSPLYIRESAWSLVPEHTVHVVIDDQNDFLHPEGWYGRNGIHIAHMQRVVEPTKRLNEECRRRGIPIVWTRHGTKELADDVAAARRLLAGEDVPGIPNGRVIREPGVNVDWSWSLDPDDFEFADLTIEVCDGLPSEVEAGTLTSERYCPWSALAIEVAPAP